MRDLALCGRILISVVCVSVGCESIRAKAKYKGFALLGCCSGSKKVEISRHFVISEVLDR
jgi:hypothetical protein